jgi:hypothetical protein
MYYFKVWKNFSKEYKAKKSCFDKASDKNSQIIMK